MLIISFDVIRELDLAAGSCVPAGETYEKGGGGGWITKGQPDFAAVLHNVGYLLRIVLTKREASSRLTTYLRPYLQLCWQRSPSDLRRHEVELSVEGLAIILWKQWDICVSAELCTFICQPC